MAKTSEMTFQEMETYLRGVNTICGHTYGYIPHAPARTDVRQRNVLGKS